MKILAIAVVASILLTGCINFHPNGGNAGSEGEAPALEGVTTRNSESYQEAVSEDPADDSLMMNSPHLKFKNVPIDGPLSKFIERMLKEGGFYLDEKVNRQAVLIGDFADFKACEVYVETLNGKDLVYKILVHFPEQNRWENLYGDYSHLKELLTTKYGKPASCEEKFIDPHGLTPKSDTERMHYVVFDKSKYETHFVTDKGEMILSIDHKDLLHAFVKLTYKDKINGDIIESHAIDDL